MMFLMNNTTTIAVSLLVFTLASCAEGEPAAVSFAGDGYTVHRIRSTTSEGKSGMNLWLVASDNEDGGRVLIDAGFDGSTIVDAQLEQLGQPDQVIVTHWHRDHAGGSARFQERGIPVVGHQGDLAHFESGEFEDPPIQSWEGNIAINMIDKVDYPRFTPTVVVDGAEAALAIGDLDVRAVHVPGHTPGSMAVRIGADAFVGDMFRSSDGVEVKSDGVVDQVFGEDLDADKRNARTLLDDGVERFFVAHGGAVTSDAVDAWAR